MRSTVLKAEVERFAARVNASSPFYVKAREGTLTVEDLHRYMANFYVLNAEPLALLAPAARRARELGYASVAAYLDKKVVQEKGHDEMTGDDVARLAAASPTLPNGDVHPASRAFVAYVASIVERDPTLFIPFLFVGESLMVLLGPEFLHNLETRCGIPRAMMISVDTHVDLDKQHAQAGAEEIDHLAGPEWDEPFLDVVRTTTRLYEDVLTALA